MTVLYVEYKIYQLQQQQHIIRKEPTIDPVFKELMQVAQNKHGRLISQNLG
jgi:hypothetical protein